MISMRQHSSEPVRMKQRAIGNSQLHSSAIGLGCMGMSEFYGSSDDLESLRTLEYALSLGVNHFDTADTYGLGHNESLIGHFLAKAGASQRQRVVIATKFGIVRSAGKYERRIDNSPAYIRQACDASLKRLGTDYIDLYYCHRRDPNIPIEEVVGVLAELLKAGKIRAIGLSEVSCDTLRRAQTVAPISALQSEYSLWSREPESEMLDLCRELGTTFVAYSPLGRSFLTGALNVTQLADNDFRKNNPRFVGHALETNTALVNALTEFSLQRGLSNSQVALAWILNKHHHVIPIPGTRRISYLESNAGSTEIVLSESEIQTLDTLFTPQAIEGNRYPDAGYVGIESA